MTIQSFFKRSFHRYIRNLGIGVVWNDKSS